jgi:hypothetical protein
MIPSRLPLPTNYVSPAVIYIAVKWRSAYIKTQIGKPQVCRERVLICFSAGGYHCHLAYDCRCYILVNLKSRELTSTNQCDSNPIRARATSLCALLVSKCPWLSRGQMRFFHQDQGRRNIGRGVKEQFMGQIGRFRVEISLLLCILHFCRYS